MMQPLRILHTESSTGLGGQELRILAESVGMVERGHAVTLAVPAKSTLRGLAVRKGLSVEPIILKKHRFPQLVREFLNVIHRHSIQIVNTHGSLDSWTASIAGRLSSCTPFVIRTRHKSTPISRTFRHRLLYRVLPHAIVTTGQTIRDNLIHEMAIDGSRVTSIPTGVDVETFKPSQRNTSTRHTLGLKPSQFVVGTIAFLRDYKGLDCLIDAAKLVVQKRPDVRFLIVGNGPQEAQLRRKIHELKLEAQVLLVGYRENISEILNEIDVFVLPSIKGEGLPQAMTQAMATQRPVVASTVGSVTEVVVHGINGLLVGPGDSVGLGEQIVLLIDDQSLRERLARAGRESIRESYDVTTMLDRTEDLYARLLG